MNGTHVNPPKGPVPRPARVYKVEIEQPVATVHKFTAKGGRTIGHELIFAFDIEDISRCAFEWWEKTTVPYFDSMKAGEWVDMFHLHPTSAVFAPWHFQTRHVPVGRTQFNLVDPPGIMVDQTKARDLFFDIRVKGAESRGRIKAHQRIIIDTTGRGRDVIEFRVLENNVPESPDDPPSW